MVSPIEPAHSPFKNVDALACPGGRQWVFGDKSPSRVPIAGLKEICRSDQTAAFVKRGADRQNARRARRKIGAVSCNGRSSLGQLFRRSEEHTSELQSLMRISYAVFCMKKTHKQ